VFTNPTWDSSLLLGSILFPSAMGWSRRCRFSRAVCLRFVSVRFSKGKGHKQYGHTSLCLFGDKLKGGLKHSSLIWHLLRGIVIWTIWIKRNDQRHGPHTWPSLGFGFIWWNMLGRPAHKARVYGVGSSPGLW
jgi:hypothetical protein